MTAIAAYRERKTARRAAHLGISIAEYEARVRAEEQRLAEINALISDRDVCRGVIAKRRDIAACFASSEVHSEAALHP